MGILGVERKVVCGFVDQDTCYGKDQAESGPYLSKRPREREGRVAGHAGGKGNHYPLAEDGVTDIEYNLTGQRAEAYISHFGHTRNIGWT